MYLSPFEKYGVWFERNAEITLEKDDEGVDFQQFKGISLDRLCQILDCTPSVALREAENGINMRDQNLYVDACHTLNKAAGWTHWSGQTMSSMTASRESEEDNWRYVFVSDGNVEYLIEKYFVGGWSTSGLREWVYTPLFNVDIQYNRTSVTLANQHRIIGLGNPVYHFPK